jgi:uncharacterized protein (DUF302 family)
MAKEGLVTLVSQHSAAETAERAKAEIEKRGMSVFTRIDHAAAARAAGLELRATEVLLFGNPRGGTPLMQADQTIGIDLPLKILVWEDEAGQVRLAYNDPLWLGARHGLPASEGERLKTMVTALQAIATAAAGS